MSQNNIIRINIDDRDINDLDTVITDLQVSLNFLNGVLKDSISQVQSTISRI